MMMNVSRLSGIFLVMLVAMSVAAFAQPTLNALTDRSVNEGELLQFTASLSAVNDSGVLSYSLCQVTAASCVASAGSITLGGTSANISAEGQFNWTPSFTAEGTYNVNITAGDSDSAHHDTFTITVNDVAPSLSSVGQVDVGDNRQRKSNPNHDDDEDVEANVTRTVTITNNGNEQLTGLAAVVSLGSDASRASRRSITLADLNSKLDLDKTTLDAGESATLTFTMRVPDKLSAIDDNGNGRRWHVADIKFTATRTESGHTSETVSSTTEVAMQTESMLEIKNGRIRFDGRSERIRNNDDVDEIRPGDTVTLELELENTFKDREDLAIEDIEVEVENDDDLDVDEREDASDLDPEDTDTVEVTFEVDEDVQRGDQELDIRVIGEDEHGAKHGERWVITLEIEREDHEISIRDIRLSPATVSCEASATVSVEARNTGRRDEDEVFVRVESPDLKFNAVSQELSLDENDETAQTFSIPIPEGTQPGNYRIRVETFYDTSRSSDTDGVILRKEACGPAAEQPEEEPKEEEPVVVVPQPLAEQPPVNITPPAPVEEPKSFFESNAFIVLLVLGYVVVLGGGALVAIKLLRK